MIWVWADLMLRLAEELKPAVEVVKRDRDVRCSEGSDDFETGVDEAGEGVYQKLVEAVEHIRGNIVDACVALGVVRRQAEAPPLRVPLEEILRLAAVDLRVVGVASDQDDAGPAGDVLPT